MQHTTRNFMSHSSKNTSYKDLPVLSLFNPSKLTILYITNKVMTKNCTIKI